MKRVEISQAKREFSKLLDEASTGTPFIITRAGKALVNVMPAFLKPRLRIRRLGFMKGQIAVPEDFDQMQQSRIEALFTAGR